MMHACCKPHSGTHVKCEIDVPEGARKRAGVNGAREGRDPRVDKCRALASMVNEEGLPEQAQT